MMTPEFTLSRFSLPVDRSADARDERGERQDGLAVRHCAAGGERPGEPRPLLQRRRQPVDIHVSIHFIHFIQFIRFIHLIYSLS